MTQLALLSPGCTLLLRKMYGRLPVNKNRESQLSTFTISWLLPFSLRSQNVLITYVKKFHINICPTWFQLMPNRTVNWISVNFDYMLSHLFFILSFLSFKILIYCFLLYSICILFWYPIQTPRVVLPEKGAI